MSSRRASLGGGALRECSSRYNSLAGRRRQSFAPVANDDISPQKPRRGLLDTTGLSSTRGDGLRSETPIRDRHAMLQAWRQARAGNRGEEVDTKKRTRADPPLPPSAAYTPSRKIQRTQGFSQDSDELVQPSQNSTPSIAFYDDESENTSRGGTTLLSARTPLSRRAKLGSARRHSLMGRSVAREGTIVNE